MAKKLTAQERAMYGMDESPYSSASYVERPTSKRTSLTAEERAMYGMDARAKLPYDLSPLQPAKSSWSSPGAESPIQWFKNLKPSDESEDASYARPYESAVASYSSAVKESPVSNHVKLVEIIPVFKKEEEALDTALLEMRSITDPREAMRLVRQFVADIRFVHPSIYTEEMIRMVIKTDAKWSTFIDSESPLVRRMFEEIIATVPTICEYWDIDNLLEEKHLYQVGYRSHFKIKDIRVSGVLYLHALCHGGLRGPMASPNKITRYSSIPLGVCEKLASTTMASIRSSVNYSNFVEKNVEHMKKLIERTHYSEDDVRYVAVKKLVGVVPKKTFFPPSQMMNKSFSCIDTTDTQINFLDIVTPTGKYNLFSIKTEWTLEEIALMFPGKEIVLCDYSCSPNAGFTQEELELYGGKRTKRKRNRRKTKRF